MNKHIRSIVCKEPQCRNLLGFSSYANLLHHQRETHDYLCPYQECKRRFRRKDHLKDHKRRVHGWDVPKMRRTEPIVRGDDGLERQSEHCIWDSAQSRVFKDVLRMGIRQGKSRSDRAGE